MICGVARDTIAVSHRSTATVIATPRTALRRFVRNCKAGRVGKSDATDAPKKAAYGMEHRAKLKVTVRRRTVLAAITVPD